MEDSRCISLDCDDPHRPAYWRDGIPCYNRRAHWHDYTSKCFYMVTVSRNDRVKIPFSIIENAGKDQTGRLRADVILTETGKLIFQSLYEMEIHFKEIKLLDNVIMPDHVHAVIYVRREFLQGLGAAVNYFKGGCTRKLRMIDREFSLSGTSVFNKGFHDRIVMREGMLSKLRNYVSDNPRRYLVRSLYPEMFNSRFVLQCRGRRWKIYGNFLLLKEPMKSPLIVSSKYSIREKSDWLFRWNSVARNCGVLVSPFYSEEEKRIRNEMIEKGAAVIHLQTEGFPERFSPKGKYHELCGEGRLLIIGEEIHAMKKVKLTRSTALALNDFARWLAAAGEEDWRIVKA